MLKGCKQRLSVPICQVKKEEHMALLAMACHDMKKKEHTCEVLMEDLSHGSVI